MSVRSDAWVAAIRANAQQHPADCTNDCCHFDALADALATGERIFSSDEEIPAGRGLKRYLHLAPKD